MGGTRLNAGNSVAYGYPKNRSSNKIAEYRPKLRT